MRLKFFNFEKLIIMKYFSFLFLCSFFIIINLNAQSITPNVINSAGNYFSNNQFSLDWSLGEVVISTISSSNNILSQGFLQPNLPDQVSTINLKDSNLEVFPNPFSNLITILDKSNLDSKWNVKLFSADGKLIINKQNVNQLAIESIPDGFYYLNILDTQNNIIETIKLSKIK